MESISAVNDFVNSGLKKVGLGSISSYEDYINLGVSVIEGMIDVLPSNSLLAFCKNNVTAT